MTKTYELPVIGNRCKSFYGKAVVKEDKEGKHLFSYGCNICTIDENGTVFIHDDVNNWDSATSFRHLKSFLMLFNKRVGSKSEIKKMYIG